MQAAPVLKAGQFRDRIMPQVATESKNALGEITKTWADGVIVWGRVRPMSGRELFIAQQMTALVTHSIQVRGRVAISVKDRITYNNRIFQIERILDIDERGVLTDMQCLELPQ